MRIFEIKEKNTAKITKTRVICIATILSLFLSYLIFNLFRLQILGNAYYKGKVYDQITTTAPLRANRGDIYDRNMNLLSTTNTTWRVFISTRDIKNKEKLTGNNYSKKIAVGLANILGLSSVALLDKIENSNVLDVTVKKSVSESEYMAVLKFVRENSLEGLVLTEAQSARYYPGGTLLAHVLGFTGSDNQGLYGLEYFYDQVLRGTDGYYLYSKDANGNTLDTEYSYYVAATDGLSLVTTIDSYLQRELEYQLAEILRIHSVQNRVTGVVMDTSTGAILAMATSSPFDPNNPYKLDEISEQKLINSGYAEGSAEYLAYKKSLLEVMWSNKAISETYEPGSTFKIITVASALDSGAASLNDRFSCHGSCTVGGWNIRCHKRTGHGSGFTLAYGLQMSCNPTMIQISERVGSEKFYDYIEGFGYFEKSGIDLPSEASTIFHKEENIGPTELATISFGQRFKVSVINHLRAISAVANGGYLVTPYLVEKIIDAEGNVVAEHTPTAERAVISSAVAEAVAAVLEEGVSGDGGAKNARVDGYKVAAKTGTSQKFDILDENGNSYLRISSTVAFAPSDESGIAVIIVVDEPTGPVKYGSVVAAPFVSAFLERALPYLNYESSEPEININVDNYVGMPIEAAIESITALSVDYEVVGDGSVVLAQTPGSGDVINSKYSKVILYTVDTEEYVTVPNLVGMSVTEAASLALEVGLNIELSGSGGGVVITQSLPLGARVRRGEIVCLFTMVVDYED